jgi:hypothetical protein
MSVSRLDHRIVADTLEILAVEAYITIEEKKFPPVNFPVIGTTKQAKKNNC